jgi:hypothetical protein
MPRRDLHAVGLYSGPVARRGPDNGRIYRLQALRRRASPYASQR